MSGSSPNFRPQVPPPPPGLREPGDRHTRPLKYPLETRPLAWVELAQRMEQAPPVPHGTGRLSVTPPNVLQQQEPESGVGLLRKGLRRIFGR